MLNKDMGKYLEKFNIFLHEMEKEKRCWKSEIFVGVREKVKGKGENIWKRKIIFLAEEREKEEHICGEEKRRSKRGK